MFLGIFLALKKVFDTVGRNFLKQFKQDYGIRGQTLFWIMSYQHNRRQHVQIDTKSSLLKTQCGVFRFRVLLRPLVLILYINNIYDISKTWKTTLLADDTDVLCCGDNLEQLLDTLRNELHQL